jgi:serine/threonine protein phosphatase PrpC
MDEKQDDKSLLVAATLKLPSSMPAAPANMRIEFGACSDIGKVRPNNQDRYLIARLRKAVEVLAANLPPEQSLPPVSREGYLLLVADGMGGCAGGERASALVVREAITHVLETAKWFFRLDDPDEEVRLRLLRDGLERVDGMLIEDGRNDPALAGMGTTLTALSLLGAEAFIVHVGDSRAYLFRDGKLEQLTQDHNVAQELVRQGLIRPEEARTHRLRHVLTNVLGGKPGVEGEVVKLRLADGDRLLLCTDGLHGSVPDDQIGEILGRIPSPEEACRDLVEAALSRGGRDNVTAVVVACSMHEGRP